MMIKMKYLGNSEDHLTTNQIYVILGITENGSHIRGALVDDEGHIHQTDDNIDDVTKWELVSVVDTGCITVFSE